MPTDLPFRQLVYGSSTCRLLEPNELEAIMRVSRINNARDEVTGALVYAGGNVMQVLEGTPEAVGRIFARVSRDDRHRRVMVLLDRRVEARAFPDWAMGLVRPEKLPPAAREEVRTLYELTEPGPGMARRLLASFRAVVPEARPPAPRG